MQPRAHPPEVFPIWSSSEVRGNPSPICAGFAAEPRHASGVSKTRMGSASWFASRFAPDCERGAIPIARTPSQNVHITSGTWHGCAMRVHAADRSATCDAHQTGAAHNDTSRHHLPLTRGNEDPCRGRLGPHLTNDVAATQNSRGLTVCRMREIHRPSFLPISRRSQAGTCKPPPPPAS